MPADAHQIRGLKRPRRCDQLPRHVHLLPDVPQQDAQHPTIVRVIEDSLRDSTASLSSCLLIIERENRYSAPS